MSEFILSKYINWGRNKKNIIKNFFSLATLEVVNYIIPIITLPYLVRILGPAKYGLVVFAQAFTTYFVIASDYGFYLAAPRLVAISRDNIEKLSKIFTNIMVIKFFFMTIYFIVFTLIIFSIKRFANESLLYFFSFGNVLGDFLLPAWFFQGMEKMNFLTFFYFFAKGFFLIMIFLFVKSPMDYIYVPMFNNLGLIIAGIVSLYVIRKNYQIKLCIPGMKEINQNIKEEFPFFIATVSNNAYTNSGPFILGLFAESTFVGYYGAAERLIRAVQRLLWAGSQSVYPYVSRVIAQSQELGLKLIRKFFIIFSGGFFLISLLIFLLSGMIVRIFLGYQYLESIIVLKILSFVPFIISVSNVLGIQTMIPMGMIKEYSKLVFCTMVFNIFLSMLLAYQYKHIGISVSVVLTEMFIVALLLITIKISKVI